MQYINRQFLVDAYQIPVVQGEIPQWLLRPQFALNMKAGKEISFALLLNSETGKPTRVEIGEWVVNDRGVLVKMTDAEFRGKYTPATENGPILREFVKPQLEMFEPEPEQDADDDWFVYDSQKPASMMSVYDYVFIEVMKARMLTGLGISTVLAGNGELTYEVLSKLGYD